MDVREGGVSILCNNKVYAGGRGCNYYIHDGNWVENSHVKNPHVLLIFYPLFINLYVSIRSILARTQGHRSIII